MRSRRPAGSLSPVSSEHDDLAGMHLKPGHLIRRAHQLHGYLWTSSVSRDVTPTQFAVLTVLADTSDVDQNAVATEASLDTSTTGSVIERLIDRGWVSVAQDSSDRRRKLLSLTEAGRQIHQTISTPAAQMTDRMVSCLEPDEREILIKLLTRVVEAGDRDRGR